MILRCNKGTVTCQKLSHIIDGSGKLSVIYECLTRLKIWQSSIRDHAALIKAGCVLQSFQEAASFTQVLKNHPCPIQLRTSLSSAMCCSSAALSRRHTGATARHSQVYFFLSLWRKYKLLFSRFFSEKEKCQWKRVSYLRLICEFLTLFSALNGEILKGF